MSENLPPQPRLLDLFSGIGGFSLGLERAGFRTVAFCEIEPFPRRVLAKHWPGVPIYDDVRTLTAERLAADGISVDAICGGFPCTDLSAAGNRAGIHADRSGLWSQFARLIGEIRPRIVVVENVTELLSGGRGSWFSHVLGDLAGVRYDAEWHCVPAAAVGANHIRGRVWIVANPQELSGVHKPDLGEGIRRRLSDHRDAWIACPWGSPSAAVCRVDDGIPHRVDRTSALGNAVVPQVVEMIGRAIMERETA